MNWLVAGYIGKESRKNILYLLIDEHIFASKVLAAMMIISNITTNCTARLVDLLQLRPSKYALVRLKHVADTYYGGSRCYIYVKQQYIAVNCTVLKYTFTGGEVGGWCWIKQN